MQLKGFRSEPAIWGRQKGSPRSVPICSVFPICFSDLFRFALLVFGICSDLFSEQIRTNQGNPFLPTPLNILRICKSPICAIKSGLVHVTAPSVHVTGRLVHVTPAFPLWGPSNFKPEISLGGFWSKSYLENRGFFGRLLFQGKRSAKIRRKNHQKIRRENQTPKPTTNFREAFLGRGVHDLVVLIVGHSPLALIAQIHWVPLRVKVLARPNKSLPFCNVKWPGPSAGKFTKVL